MRATWLAALLTTACAGATSGCRDRRPQAVIPAADAAAAAAPAAGLTAGEASRFFHDPIGCDPLPQFILAEMKQPDGRPFLDDLVRFGLLPASSEEHNAERLPIGMTVYLPFDLQPFNLRFYGFTCAVCHVGEVASVARRPPARIIGAPGRFDLARFQRELIAAAEPILTQLPALLPVMLSYYDEVTREPEDMTDPTGLKRILFQSILGRQATDGEARDFRDSLRRDLELVRRAVLRLSTAEVVRQDPLLGRQADVPTARIAASAATVRLATGGSSGPASLAELPARERMAIINGLLGDTFHVLRLLRARVEYARESAASAAGPGRVDILRAASLALGVDASRTPYAPVAAPPLWNTDQLPRIHWDNNTNSIVEHGILMAIALGAPIHPRTYASNIQPRALGAAALITARLRSPLGVGSDPKLASSGRAVFLRECARCHQPQRGAGFVADGNVGTDPARIDAYAEQREGLERLLSAVKARAYARASIHADEQGRLEAGRMPARWYPPEGYAPRSLAGVWATAPYLHNDSVLSLADLLNTDRPSRFERAVRGNGNSGHGYGTALTAEEKLSLLEFLKSL